MFDAFLTIVKRDLTLAMRRRSDMLTILFFFVVVVSLFPLGIGPEMNTLRLIAPGVVWVAALLASMLALERLCWMRRVCTRLGRGSQVTPGGCDSCLTMRALNA